MIQEVVSSGIGLIENYYFLTFDFSISVSLENVHFLTSKRKSLYFSRTYQKYIPEIHLTFSLNFFNSLPQKSILFPPRKLEFLFLPNFIKYLAIFIQFSPSKIGVSFLPNFVKVIRELCLNISLESCSLFSPELC